MAVDVVHFGKERSRKPQIVATSTYNPLAVTPYQTWAFRRAEITAFTGSPFRLPDGARLTFARVRQLDPRMIGTERLVALATKAVAAIGDVLTRIPTRARFGVVLCLPERCDDRSGPNSWGWIRRRVETAVVAPFITAGFELTVRVVTSGHASFGQAAKDAGRMLDERKVDLALLVAVDSYYDPFVLEALIDQEKVLSGEWRESFVPGEASATMLLARPEVVTELGLESLGSIDSVGTNEEVATAENEVGLLGLGLSRPAVALTRRLKEEGRTLDWWLSDATGETFRIQELQLAWPRAAHLAQRKDQGPDFLPSHFGDVGAATMGLGAVLALEGLRRGDPEGHTALVTGSSVDGDRAVILLSAAGS